MPFRNCKFCRIAIRYGLARSDKGSQTYFGNCSSQHLVRNLLPIGAEGMRLLAECLALDVKDFQAEMWFPSWFYFEMGRSFEIRKETEP
ncbi:hypothetical protein CEXT_443011 [Caerostris extrusa]|uniref:Uncharacterized protein n=1 Tax=Caerostris extrusa TaxID=172846 RepID=A0AAV4NNJ7_CAEEX|nr:hypothetical protein CEXT_443011 [Caerostris extrusa]